MFPELQKKLCTLYTCSTGLILTLILGVAFLFYLSSQDSRRESAFLDQLFTLTTKLQSDSKFNDSYLAQMESKNRLLIYIEENESPLFFPGVYQSATGRSQLFAAVEDFASSEGISSDALPVSSSFIQSSIFEIRGDTNDCYLGSLLLLKSGAGYKKMILLQDITSDMRRTARTGLFYILIGIIGIVLLYVTGKKFVRHSLHPLEELYAKQQDFVAAASHELRSPLAVVSSSSEALAGLFEEENALSEDMKKNTEKILRQIRSECKRGNSLVKNLLLLASAEQERWALNRQIFEIDELLLKLMELYEPLFYAQNGRLLLELPETPLPAVYADADLCRQIILILLDNALAYGMGASRSVILRAKYVSAANISRKYRQKKRPHVKIHVIDFGQGIPDDIKPRIFDAFYQQNKARNQKEHFGLGLSIAAKLAHIQNTELEVTDTAGGGCTFLLSIPVARHPKESAEKSCF